MNKKMTTMKKKSLAAPKNEDNAIFIPPKAFIILLVGLIVVSFLLGCLTLLVKKSTYGHTTPLMTDDINQASGAECMMTLESISRLPSPTLPEGRKFPILTYSSKTFPTVLKATATSNTVFLDRVSTDQCIKTIHEKGSVIDTHTIDADPQTKSFSHSADPIADAEGPTLANDDNEDDEAIHHPSGQHLLIDIKHVDANFLNSEKRLASSMIEVIKESQNTLLSYHCHSLVPVGVSCVGVLLESHIALHTWPLEGVMSLDVYTCGSGQLMPLLPSIERLFAVHQVQNKSDPATIFNAPTMLWSHKLRGFRERGWNPLEHDLGADVLSKRFLGLKRHLVSVETDFQTVDVVEVLDPRFDSMVQYQKSLSNDGSYESLHPELFYLNRNIYLNGQIQSSLKGERAYHEALVHPAMITHPNPKRVAIIGGGEGATLREVLKHNTVENAIMIEIDRKEVEILREYAPEWSNCSDFSEGSGSCYDDPRAELLTVDAIQWFMNHFFSEDISKTDSVIEKFDIIIMDALDPNDGIEFSAALYNSSSFELSLRNALTDNGILVAQLGRSPTHKDPADEVGEFSARADMVVTLKNLGFESFHVYDEPHNDFDAPWSYLVALKDQKLRANWYRTAPEIDIDLKKRIYRSKMKSGDPILRRFDAPTMIQYQVPPKTFEVNYCRQSNAHNKCKDLLNMCRSNVSKEDLKVRKSTVGEGAGRGLFAARDLPKHSCLLVDDHTHSFQVLPSTWSVIDDMHEAFRNTSKLTNGCDLSSLVTFISGYGYVSLLMGTHHWSVDSDILFFMNHGCNQSYNYGEEYSVTNEINADLDSIPNEYDMHAESYSPWIERHLLVYRSGPDRTLRDIREGEEILANYLAFVADDEEWEDSVLKLRGKCNGRILGEVSEYELRHG